MANMQKIGAHKTSVNEDGQFCAIRYHATDVVKFNDKEIILNSGGWRTNTTKTRMNQTSNEFGLGFRVFQEKGYWWVEHGGQESIYTDGIVLRRS